MAEIPETSPPAEASLPTPLFGRTTTIDTVIDSRTKSRLIWTYLVQNLGIGIVDRGNPPPIRDRGCNAGGITHEMAAEVCWIDQQFGEKLQAFEFLPPS